MLHYLRVISDVCYKIGDCNLYFSIKIVPIFSLQIFIKLNIIIKIIK